MTTRKNLTSFEAKCLYVLSFDRRTLHESTLMVYGDKYIREGTRGGKQRAVREAFERLEKTGLVKYDRGKYRKVA